MTDTVTPPSTASLPDLPRLPNGHRPRKLRGSCIHCANSKVKCNKEKPVCSRCVRRRLECEYKVSRRTGRTSRTANRTPGAIATAEATTTVSPALQTTAINTNTSILSSVLVNQAPLPSHNTNIPTTQSSPEPCPGLTPDIWRSILSPSALEPDVGDFSSLLPMGTDIGDILSSVILSPQFDTCGIDAFPNQSAEDTPSVTDETLFPLSGLSDTKQVGPSSAESKSPTCCLTIILNILTDLFPNAPTACKRPGSQPVPSRARTVETVISENKQVIETINSVLDCSCSQDEYVISIVSLAVFKVMGWYVAAARDRTSTSGHNMDWNSDLQVHCDRASPSSFDEQVSYVPAVVGNYCINGDDHNRMAAQLVLGELHRVQRLVNVLSSRLESIRLRTCLASASTSGSSNVTDSGDIPLFAVMRTSPLSGTTFSQLEEDLRKRLRAISSETIEILRRA